MNHVYLCIIDKFKRIHISEVLILKKDCSYIKYLKIKILFKLFGG